LRGKLQSSWGMWVECLEKNGITNLKKAIAKCNQRLIGKKFKVLSYLQFKCPGISAFPLVNLYVDVLYILNVETFAAPNHQSTLPNV
jgi:hypothetical protein